MIGALPLNTHQQPLSLIIALESIHLIKIVIMFFAIALSLYYPKPLVVCVLQFHRATNDYAHVSCARTVSLSTYVLVSIRIVLPRRMENIYRGGKTSFRRYALCSLNPTVKLRYLKKKAFSSRVWFFRPRVYWSKPEKVKTQKFAGSKGVLAIFDICER